MRNPIPILVFASLSLTPATAATAAERSVAIGSFDRVRVDAPIAVRIATNASPSARISGDDDAIEAVDVRLNGTTLTIGRRSGAWQERPGTAAASAPVSVTLATGSLAGVTVIGAGTVTAGMMKANRVDLSVSGPGTIAVAAIDADQASATVIGGGTVTVAGGRVRTARLTTNGPGTIDADALDAGEVAVRLDGPGDLRARARFTASVNSTGTGRVAIAGSPKCQVRASAGGPVTCGAGTR